jgi:ribosomal protein S18 acetylase RimI-like enzyme
LKKIDSTVEFRARDGRLVAIRDIERSDLGAMLKFANAMVREKRTNREMGVASFDKRLTRDVEKKFVNKIVDLSRRGNGANAVAFVDGALVGECTLQRRIPSDERHTAVLGIAVLAGFRGIGIGEELMRQVLLKARRLGVWLVELEVMKGNVPAVRLYEKLGFRTVGVIPNKILRDGKLRDIVAMYAELRGSDKSLRTRRRKS